MKLSKLIIVLTFMLLIYFINAISTICVFGIENILQSENLLVNIEFTTEAITEVEVDDNYYYDADAQSNSSDTIKYRLAKGAPDGLTVDVNTGVIQWQTSVSGTFTITLEAFFASAPESYIEQTWDLIVKKHSIFKGTVSTYDGTLIKYAYIKIYSTDNSRSYSIRTDENGTFYRTLHSGNYKLFIDGDKIESTWYNDKTFVDADTIQFIWEKTYTMNLRVRLKKYSVSGNVSPYNREPIDGVEINFFGFREDSVFLTSAVTDSLGYYSVELEQNVLYRAGAFKDGEYAARFYTDAFDYAAAAPFYVTKAIENVNFFIQQLPKSTVLLSGAIINNDSSTIPCIVTAYQIEKIEKADLYYGVSFVNSVYTSNGEYSIKVPISKDYIIKAYPITNNNYPIYYSKGSSPIISWEDSDIIEVDELQTLDSINIRTGKIIKTFGSGIIKGNIRIDYVTFMTLMNSWGIPGFTIFAVDSDDKINKYTFSLAEINGSTTGEYVISNLALKEWKIAIDNIGWKNSQNEIASLSEDYIEEVINFTFVNTSNVNDKNIYQPLITIYPNPTKNSININISSNTNQEATIRVFDLLGNVLINKEVFITEGSNEYRIDTKNLNSGTYHLSITDKYYNSHALFNILK